ncbi:MAG: fimbrillin family protein [Bacteroidales bacterium]
MRVIIVFIIVINGLMSCTIIDDNSSDLSNVKAEFKVSVSGIISKGPIENNDDLKRDEKVGIFSIKYVGTNESAVVWPFAQEDYMMYNVEGTISDVGGKSINTSAPFFYPSEEKVCFYSYYPYSSIINFTASGKPTINVEIPSSPIDQKDYLWSVPVTGADISPRVNFVYNHALSLIRVKINKEISETITIKEISISTEEPQKAKMDISNGEMTEKYIADGKNNFVVSNLNIAISDALITSIENAKFLFIPGSKITSISIKIRIGEEANERLFTILNPSIILNKGEAKNIVLTVKTKTDAIITAWEDNPQSDIFGKDPEPESNCYMIDSKSDNRTILIPVSRVENGANAVNSIYGSTVLTFNKNSAWSPEIIWQTWNPVANNKHIIVTKCTNEFIQVVIPEDVNGNNALIAIRQNEKILWSWHLWITDYSPVANGISGTEDNKITHRYSGNSFSIGGLYENMVIMDRNLGATWTGPQPILPSSIGDDGSKASTAYGLYYQWGRKDPFPSAITNGSYVKLYNSSGVEVSLTSFQPVPGVNNLSYSIDNPFKFIICTAYPYDWYTNSAGLQNNYLWNTKTTNKKTLFDPCPHGWRIPRTSTTNSYSNPWAGFRDGIANNVTGGSYVTNSGFDFYLNNVVSSGSGSTGGRLYTQKSGNPLSKESAWYPANGFIHYNSSNVQLVGTRGYIQTAAVSGSYITIFDYYDLYVNPDATHSRGYGFSVRCIQEN